MVRSRNLTTQEVREIVNIRRATEADEPTLRELWEEFGEEVPEPVGEGETWAEEWRDTAEDIRRGVVLIAEDDEGPAGYARLGAVDHGRCEVTMAYVRPRARRRGLTKAFLRELTAAAREQGAEHLTLEVVSSNAVARTVWERLGFTEVVRTLAAPVAALEARLGDEAPAPGSRGSVHVQTDDAGAVERAVRQFVPRMGRSGGSVVAAPRNGWTAAYDQLVDRDPKLLRRLARELSDRMGAVVIALGIEDGAVVRMIAFERGRIADEYASVPDYHAPLPPGDVIALRANPTVLARLAGAEPARVREVARNAESTADLPPAQELAAGLAAVLGLEGGAVGYEEAAGLPGVTLVSHG